MEGIIINILVVGNGFDLAHGLPTKYSQFLDFIKVYKCLTFNGEVSPSLQEKFNGLHSDIKSYLNLEEVRFKTKHSGVLKEFDDLLENNVWLEVIKESYNLRSDNWVDFEQIISEKIQALDYLFEYCDKYMKTSGKAEYDDELIYQIAYSFVNKLINIKKNTLKKQFYPWVYDNKGDIVATLLNDLKGVIRALEIYLGEFVYRIKDIPRNSQIEELSDVDFLLSFNYTNTYKKLYDKMNRVKYDYIHGYVRENEDITNNMVLGINEYLCNGEENKKVDFIEFKKYFQRIVNRSNCDYKKEIEYIEEYSDDHDIYFYGHSLDVTDGDCISELIDLVNVKGNDVRVIIYYLNDDDYKQKTINLVKILGYKTLEKYLYGSDPKIMFEKII